MDWDYLLSTYGYPAVFIGTFLEGESILVAAGYFASGGSLYLPYVIAAAFFGSFSGDQLFFFIGRRHGHKVLRRFPKLEARVHRIFRLFERWHTVYILGFRFLYGLRTLSPFVLGTSNVTTRRFFFLNGIGAITWATTVAFLGYAAHHAVERLMGRAKHYEKIFLVVVVLVALILAIVAHRRARRRAEQQDAAEEAAGAAARARLTGPVDVSDNAAAHPAGPVSELPRPPDDPGAL